MMKIFLLKLGFFLSGLIWGVYALAAQPLQNKHLSGGLVHSLYIDSTGNVWVWGGSSLDGVSNELIQPTPTSTVTRHSSLNRMDRSGVGEIPLPGNCVFFRKTIE